MFVVPDYIVYAVSLLESAGYEAYVVGGCVRDCVMGRTPCDWDMTTNASTDDIKRVFGSHKLIETGIKHGTVTVLLGSMPVEITTYRIDGEYLDRRHPASVSFCSSLTEDLSRRDFTVNAIAYNPSKGIVDPFGGLDDIEKKLIRCVGEPDKRFNEDALRILRAVRFASVLGFEIEEHTAESALKLCHTIGEISAERICSETKKLICGDNIGYILKRFSLIITQVFPVLASQIGFDQKNFHHSYTLWEHTCHAVIESENSLTVRLMLLLHDCGKPFCQTFDSVGQAHYYMHATIGSRLANDALLALRFDNDMVKAVTELIRLHDTPIIPDRKLLKRKLNRLGEQKLRMLIAVQRGDNSALAPALVSERLRILDECSTIVDAIIAEKECFSLKELEINGNDLASLGLKGKEIGQALSFVLEAVIDGKAENRRDCLLELCSRQQVDSVNAKQSDSATTE